MAYISDPEINAHEALSNMIAMGMPKPQNQRDVDEQVTTVIMILDGMVTEADIAQSYGEVVRHFCAEVIMAAREKNPDLINRSFQLYKRFEKRQYKDDHGEERVKKAA